jgi:hypothetical protein
MMRADSPGNPYRTGADAAQQNEILEGMVIANNGDGVSDTN